MEANEELQISIDLITYFYQELIVSCNSIEELSKKGYSWIEEIKAKYNSEVISNYIRDILLTALANFTGKQGIKYNALIMKGGGIKGIAYIGALEELLKHYTFNWYAGTSAGAITAILLGSGYTVEELGDILGKKNFNDFKDANGIKALFNLFTKRGLYEANSFNKWLEELLAEKLDTAFSVEMRDLTTRTTVFASRKDKSVQIFDSHKSDSQKAIAAFAARCSMSIPYIFTPQKIDGRNVLDGGLKNNFPVDLILEDNLDSDFIGLYLGNKTYKYKKSSVFHDIFQTWTESHEPEILRKYKEKVIIIDPSPISTLKFKLNDVEKEFLLENGRLAALEYLDKNNLIKKEDFNFKERKLEIEELRQLLTNKKRRPIKIILITILLALLFFIV